MTFHTKFCLVQNHFELDLMEWIGLSKFMMAMAMVSYYLVLFDSEKHDAIYNRLRYLISQKCGTTFVASHNYASRTNIDYS